MDTAKKQALAEFSRRAMQRLQDKKIPKLDRKSVV